MVGKEKQDLGACPICGRPMISGTSLNEHHLIPKSLKGKEKIQLHKICHQKIHSIFSERELQKEFNTVERLKNHAEIKKFILWVARKAPEFYQRNKTSNVKRENKKQKQRR